MPRESFSPSTSRYGPLQSAEASPPVSGPDHELSSADRPTGATFTGSYHDPAMNHASFEPPAQYTSNMYDGPSHQVEGLEEQYTYRGNDGVGHHCPPPVASQHISDLSIVPVPPLLDYCAPPPPPQEMSYNGAIGGAPPFTNVASTSQGIPGAGPSGMSAGKDLKDLASQYLHSDDSRVDKVRVKQSRRSGRVKVMILLEI